LGFVWLGRDGRAAPNDSGAVCGFEPRADAACRTSGRLALIERRRASGPARRRPRERRAGPRPLGRPLRRFHRDKPSAEALSALPAAETIGHPLGSAAFLNCLAALVRPRSASETAGPESGLSALQPKTAFARFAPVHRADLEGRQRVVWPVRQAVAGWPLFAQRGRQESA